jgi:hypothetical protein
MKHYESKAVVCPFYHQEQATKIHCDGVSKDNTVQISFTNQEAKNKYRKDFCLNIKTYTKCPIYQAIAKQWEDEDDD